MWEDSSPAKLFRRKNGGESTLPRFVDSSPSDDKKSKFRMGKYAYAVALVSTIIIIFFFLGGFSIFSEQSEYLYSSGYVDEDDESTGAISMEDLVKRHPYAFQEASTAELEMYASSTLLTKGPPRKLTEPEVSASQAQIEDEIPKRSVEEGNIVFFSFHGKVGNAVIMKALSEQLGYEDGGDLLLQQKVRHNESLSDKWESYDERDFDNANKRAIIEVVNEVFAGYGSLPLKQRKMLSVHMTDAWANQVSISWLLEVLQRVGGVTHVVAVVRNPIRAKISDISEKHYGAVMSKSKSCEDRRYMFEIGREDVLDMVVAQHSGIREAMSVTGMKFLGLSYEADLHRDVMVAMEKVADFAIERDEGAPVLRNVPFDYHSRCDLSIELYNYKEIECVFGPTTLSWLIHESGESLDFHGVMKSGEDFLAYAFQQKELNNDIMSPRVCRVPANLTMLNEYKTKLTKTRGRCGHGGHKEICRGYGKTRDFVCGHLLRLAAGDCTALTFANGECYLHDANMEDFWTGDCAPNSYWAHVSNNGRV